MALRSASAARSPRESPRRGCNVACFIGPRLSIIVDSDMLVKRPLGNTGIGVSAVALGTVELGIDYGFRGSSAYQRPARDEALSLVRQAVDLGINLIDTAPSYGESESILGEACDGIPGRPYFATKITVPTEDADAAIRRSIENSRRALQVETLDAVQIHNPTPENLTSREVLRALEDAVRDGQ